jgi:hypothetical protein
VTYSLVRHPVRPRSTVWKRPPDGLGWSLLRTLAARVWDIVIDNADRSSSLVASLSTTVEQLEGRVDATTTNRVCWGTQSVLVTALSQFLELDVELELLGSRRNADLMVDQVDAFWTWVHTALDSLASRVLPLVARSPPDGAGE